MSRRMQHTIVPLIGLIVAIGCGSGSPQTASATTDELPQADRLAGRQMADASAAPATGGAKLEGSVKFTGTAPAPVKVKMDADPQCQMQHKEAVTKQDVVVNSNGTLQNVFVYVKDGLQGQAFPAPKDPVKLTQQGCQYMPHVLGVQVSQPLEIVNDDATLHNVNCKATKSKPFNIAQPQKGMKSTKSFTAPETMVKCACNVHPWMSTYIGVVDHPFFGVTGDQGTFSLAGLPAGTYTLEAWHEKYGTQTQQVTVGADETKQVEFQFSGQ